MISSRTLSGRGDVVREVRSAVKKADVQFERLPVNELSDEALDILPNNLALNNIVLCFCGI